MAVISGFSNLGNPSDITPTFSMSNAEQEIVEMIDEEEKTLTTREVVEQYFADIPIMVDIARCESRFVQLNKDGSVHRGKLTPADVGVMQINEKYHLSQSRKLGYDIHTIEGNLAYARYLYEKQGARPWLASSQCWAKYSEIARS